MKFQRKKIYESSETVNNTKKRFTLVIIGILVAMILLIVYTAIAYYNNMSSSLMSVGENSLSREKEQVNAYLQKSVSILDVSAVDIESMLANGEDAEDVYRLLNLETDKFATDFDENYTGIYAYIEGTYIDGTDWVPDDDFVPTERDWYKEALQAQGETVISSPYVDSMTGKIIISISKLLDDGESVVSMDITLDEIQSITEKINLNNSGYGLITDSEGLVIAHTDSEQIGTSLTIDEKTYELFNEVTSKEQGHIETKLDNERVIVFYENIVDDWYAVMIISRENMYGDVFEMILGDAAVCIALLLVVVLFVLFVFHRITESVQKEEESRRKADNMYLSIMRTLVQAIDAKDEYTNGHSQRVAAYSKELAIRMGKNEEAVQNVYYAALLHDVGKIRIPDSIINKKGRLDDNEYATMKLHPVSGYHILKHVENNPLISVGAREHHERYDGKGYPNGLSGKNISEIGRIIAVADAYDAMTSNRSYRPTMEQGKVRAQIEGGRGTQFDPEIADIMLKMIDEDVDYNMCEKTKRIKNILLVDDDSMQHTIFKHIVKGISEYNVKDVFSGTEALEAVKKDDFDVILLDIQMHDMDGYETYEKLKELTSARVIFLTGDSSRESMERAYEMGITDYLIKPLRADIIKEVLRSIFRNDID